MLGVGGPMASRFLISTVFGLTNKVVSRITESPQAYKKETPVFGVSFVI
jgi:hypothetical protein